MERGPRESMEHPMVDRRTALNALDELAAAVGIEESYADARGELHATAPATKRALLRALGIEAEDDAAARRTLESMARAEWERALPPTAVVRAGEIVVALNLPSEQLDVGWTVFREDGTEQHGAARPGARDVIAQRRVADREYRRVALTLPDLPLGYHRLRIDEPKSESALIVVPDACWLPPAFRGGTRSWGLAVQLYALRSALNWGIGDFGDLQALAGLAADEGADAIGLNPVHALFVDEPERASPYSPASRMLLNVLSIDVSQIAGFATAQIQAQLAEPELVARLARVRAAKLVAYTEVAALKLPILRRLFALRDPHDADFDDFRRAGGEALQRDCLFVTLHAFFLERDGTADWHDWPNDARDPESPWVAAFAARHEAEISFHVWLQWVADEQLATAAAAADRMRIGLFRDLAVGADPGGAETWSNRYAVVDGASVGAPPDLYNPAGQNWGLPPFHPLRLPEDGYRSFARLLQANMRHAGAIRIDHAMALQHLYLIPHGCRPADGAYVRYPLEDLVGIVALESRRNRCLVIGEDLGTVPAGFRERMAQARILSYRVLFFETDPESGAFLAPAAYPRLALAVVSSHDLPTLAAWWRSADIDLKAKLQLYPSPAEERRQREERRRARAALLEALNAAGLLDSGAEPSDDALYVAVHTFLARSRALLALAQLDDVAGEIDPVNVPATTDEQHPNWRRRLGLPLEALSESARWRALVAAFAAAGRGTA